MFANAIVAAVLALPLLTPSFAAQDGCTRTYTVKEGDWCDTISSANNVSTYQLSATNDDIDDLCSNLAIGDELCLGKEGQDCEQIYVVQPNDTVDDIASALGVNSSMVLANNPQLEADSSNLYIGEVLAVCGAVKVPPMPASGNVAGSTIPAGSSPAVPDDDDTEWCD